MSASVLSDIWCAIFETGNLSGVAIIQTIGRNLGTEEKLLKDLKGHLKISQGAGTTAFKTFRKYLHSLKAAKQKLAT